MDKLLKTLLLVAGIGLLLNVAWENLQGPLYQGYNNFWQHLPICSMASLGDALIILVLYFVLALINKNMFWAAKISRADVVIVIALGALVAVGIEKWALAVVRWQYSLAMPVIPYVDVGFFPVVQMMLLPVLTFYFTRKLYDIR